MIRLAKPSISPAALENTSRVLASGQLVRGPMATQFEKEVAQRIGVEFAVSCSSGTMANWLLLNALQLPRNAKVAVPAFTFVGVANAVVFAGGIPVPVDVRPEDGAIDPQKMEELARSEDLWGAIIVDPFGFPVSFTPYEAVAEKHELILVEDAACAIGCKPPNGPRAGARGAGAILSFHPRKPVTSGEGGMILTNDFETYERCRLLTDHGFDPDLKTYVTPGFNGRMSDLAAAVGLDSLGRFEEEVEARTRVLADYMSTLTASGADEFIQLLLPEEGASWNVQSLVGILKTNAVDVSTLCQKARSEDIELGGTAQYWPALAGYESTPSDNHPVSEDFSAKTFALPMHGQLSSADVIHVMENIVKTMRSAAS